MSEQGLRTDPIQGKIVHEYDGIEEADNNLPIWWLWTFYGAIVFSIGYWFYYHEFAIAPLPGAAYDAEQAAIRASAPAPLTDEQLAGLGSDTVAIEAGRALFQTNCVACHEAQGQGKIGPNLTDRFWIHGGAPSSIHKVIVEGVAAKGMPGWAPMLGAEGVKKVTAFLLSIRNTDVAGKPAEGEPWPPGASP